MKIRHLQHQFVRHVPPKLEQGVLYISMEFATAVHSCCCGCGEPVVTPFTPTDWKLIFDGESVSLWPSIGSWTLPCRSHYVIRHGSVIDALPCSDAKIAAARRKDKAEKEHYYGSPIPQDPKD